MILLSLGVSLAVTLAVETPVAIWQKIPYKSALLINVITNPLAVLLYHWGMYFALPTAAVLAVIEVAVVISEWRFYVGKHAHPFVFSLCVNALSFGIGLLI